MLLGYKLKMSQIFKDGKVIPITVIEAGPVTVLEIKKEPYSALKVGFGQEKKSKKTKPPFKYIKEFRVPLDFLEKLNLKPGEQINVSFLKEGDTINISGLTKGKGFQGVVKRHNFAGGPKSHGQQDRLRHPGSIGPSYPQRVFKGRKMAGRMGQKRITIKTQIIEIDPEHNLLAIKGSAPGSFKSLLEIRPGWLTQKGNYLKK